MNAYYLHFTKYYLGMKSFKKFIHEPPGAGYWGTHELRKRYVSDTPGQVDPVTSEEPTPQIFQSRSSKTGKQQQKQSKLKK
jgi:hypothetical protein